MMLDATQHYADPLTEDVSLGGIRLFPTDALEWKNVVGDWLTINPARCSGFRPIGRRRCIIRPLSQRIPRRCDFPEMVLMGLNLAIPVLTQVSLTLVWTIHPFEDGNGRIARAITDMALALSENSTQRFYSMSAQLPGAKRLLQHAGESQKAAWT